MCNQVLLVPFQIIHKHCNVTLFMLVPYAILNRSRKSSFFEAFYSTQELLLTLIFQSNWGKMFECWTNSLLWGRVRAIWYVGYLFSLSKWCWIRWPHLPHLMGTSWFPAQTKRKHITLIHLFLLIPYEYEPLDPIPTGPNPLYGPRSRQWSRCVHSLH